MRDGEAPDDLISLSEVNEASILEAIRRRFDKQVIYTSCGAVLMVLNPFATINNLYGPTRIREYEDPFAEKLKPHIYHVTSKAYYQMCSFDRNQSILISGESGAGKTESTKQCLSFLTTIAREPSHSSDPTRADVGQRIVAASPIMEAFGNAQTVRNPNSSRFGKWMELNFNSDNRIVGSTIVSYLLEKSRLTNRNAALERNYHIFYQLLRGLSPTDLGVYGLVGKSSEYSLLCRVPGVEAPDLKDAATFLETLEAFEDMGFNGESVEEIFRVIAGVLLLGNVEFEETNNGESSRVSERPDGSTGTLVAAAQLGVDDDMLRNALCNRSIQSGSARRSVTLIQLNADKAADSRDSLIRTIYDHLFQNIVGRINENNRIADIGSVGETKSLGLLDVFGFEIFEENSFEQLCINYCNEMLQNHFNFVIFTAEMDLYLAEEIECSSIAFKDNLPIINDIEIAFKGLDEEARIPKGSSKTWFEKMKKAGSAKYPSFQFHPSHSYFSVKHYAGSVTYLPQNFLEKNIETLHNDLVAVMATSSLPLVQHLFERGDAPQLSPSVKNMSSKRESNAGNAGAKSIAWKFQQQLTTLMTMLRSTESHFVRCIKSNAKCQALVFESDLIQKQLLYSGVFEVVKIQQSGLPVRKKHDVFLKRFRCLAPMNLRKQCKTPLQLIGILKNHECNLVDIHVGKTMTFYKGKEEQILESKRTEIFRISSVLVQAWWSCRIRRFLYGQAKSSKAAILANIDLFDVNGAHQWLDYLDQVVVYFHRISGRQVLEHVFKNMSDKVVFLREQLETVQKAEVLANENSYTSLAELGRLLEATKHLQLSTHPFIASCEVLSRSFAVAVEFAANLSAISSSESEDLSREMGLEEMDVGIKSLHQFKAIIPDSLATLKLAETRKKLLQKEIEELSKRIVSALHSEQIVIDADGGLHLEKAEVKGKVESLGAALSSIDASHLVSKDGKFLYEDCKKLVHILEELVPHEKFEEIIQHTDSFASANETVLQRKTSLRVWADARLYTEKLVSALRTPGVPTISDMYEAEVDTDELQRCVEHMSGVADLPLFAKSTSALCELILNVRTAFIKERWDEMAKCLSRANEISILSSPRFAEAAIEVTRAKRIADYFAHLERMSSICLEKAAHKISVKKGNWNDLLEGVAERCEWTRSAAEFVEADRTLIATTRLADNFLKLRQHIVERDVLQAKALEQESRGFLISEGLTISSQVKLELDVSAKLIEYLEKEGLLKEALLSVPLVDADDWYCLPSEQFLRLLVPSTRLLQEAILSTESVVDMAEAFERNVALAKLLLQARQLFGITTASESRSRSWRSDKGALLQSFQPLRMFAMKTSCTNCAVEMEGVIQELHRREYYWPLVDHLTKSVVVGNVGGLLKAEGTSELVLDAAGAALHGLYANWSEQKDVFPPLVTSKLDGLFQLAMNVHQMRLAVCNKEWTTARDIHSLKLAVDSNLLNTEEIALCKNEIELCLKEANFQLTTDQLKAQLERLGYSMIFGAIELKSIDVSHLAAAAQELLTFQSSSNISKRLITLSSNVEQFLSSVKKGSWEINQIDEIHRMTQCYSELQLSSDSFAAISQFAIAQETLHSLYNIVIAPPEERHKRLPIEILRASSMVKFAPALLPWIDMCKSYGAVERAKQADDWSLAETTASVMHEHLQKFSDGTDWEKRLKTRLLKDCTLVLKHCRSKEASAHLNIVLSSAPMKCSTSGFSLAVPNRTTTLLEEFLERTMNGSEAEDDEFGKLLQEANALVKTRKTALKCIADDWKTSSVLQQELLQSGVVEGDASAPGQLCNEEFSMLTSIGNFHQLSHELENFAAIEVVTWDDEQKTLCLDPRVRDEHLYAIRNITEPFPRAMDDYPLLKILSLLHDLIGIWSNGTVITVEDKSIRLIRHLLKVQTIPGKCSQAINRQVQVFEKFALVNEILALVRKGTELFETKCYAREEFDGLLSRISHLRAATGGESTVHDDVNATIRCFSLAREVCWASGMQLIAECRTFSEELEASSLRAGPKFRRLVVTWISKLPAPQTIEVGINAAQIMQATKSIWLEEGIDTELNQNSLSRLSDCADFFCATGENPSALQNVLVSSLIFCVVQIYRQFSYFKSTSGVGPYAVSAATLLEQLPLQVDFVAVGDLLHRLDVIYQRLLEKFPALNTEKLDWKDPLVALIRSLHEAIDISCADDSCSRVPLKFVQLTLEALKSFQEFFDCCGAALPPAQTIELKESVINLRSDIEQHISSALLRQGGIDLEAYDGSSLGLWTDSSKMQDVATTIKHYECMGLPRMAQASGDMNFLKDLLIKAQLKKTDNFSEDQRNQVVGALQLIVHSSSAGESFISHGVLAKQLLWHMSSVEFSEKEGRLRHSLRDVLESSSPEEEKWSELGTEVSRLIASLRDRAPLLREAHFAIEGTLLWKVIIRSKVGAPYVAPALSTVAEFFDIKDDSERTFSRIESLLVLHENRRLHRKDIDTFLRNRKEIDVFIDDLDDATLRFVVSKLIEARESEKKQHAPISDDDTLALFTGIETLKLNRHVVHLLLLEQCLRLQRKDDVQSEAFFDHFIEKIQSGGVSIVNAGSFFASQSNLHSTAKTANSTWLQMLWKDSEIMCTLCDLVTSKSQSLSPFEVKKVMCKLEAAIEEFSKLSLEAELLGTIKFYFSSMLQAIEIGERASFQQLELPPMANEDVDEDFEQEFGETITELDEDISRIRVNPRLILHYFRLFCHAHFEFESIIDDFHSNVGVGVVHSNSRKLSEQLHALLVEARQFPEWFVQQSQLSQAVETMLAALTETEKICAEKLFSELVTAAVQCKTTYDSETGQEFIVEEDDDKVERVRLALGDYIFSRSYLGTTQLTRNSTNNKSVHSTEELVHRANLIYRLRHAISRDLWVPATDTGSSSNADASEGSHDRLNLQVSSESAQDPPEKETELLSVQEVLEMWYRSIPFPDTGDGSAEIQRAYDQLCNKILVDRFICHSNPVLEDNFDLGFVLEAVCTERGFQRLPNVATNIARLEMYFDLLLIKELGAFWALTTIPKTWIEQIGSDRTGDDPALQLYRQLLRIFQFQQGIQEADAPLHGEELSRIAQECCERTRNSVGKKIEDCFELLIKQCQLLASRDSVDKATLLGGVENWACWTDDDWNTLHVSGVLAFRIELFRRAACGIRRKQLMEGFQSHCAATVEWFHKNVQDAASAQILQLFDMDFAAFSTLDSYFVNLLQDVKIPPDQTQERVFRQLHRVLDMNPNSRSAGSMATVINILEDILLTPGSDQRSLSATEFQFHGYIPWELTRILNSAWQYAQWQKVTVGVTDELQRTIDISECNSREDIANLISNYFVSINLISLTVKKMMEETHDLKHAGDLIKFDIRQLEVFEWTLRMRLALLTEDWKSVDHLHEEFNGKKEQMLRYSPEAAELLCTLTNTVMTHNVEIERLQNELGVGMLASNNTNPAAAESDEPGVSLEVMRASREDKNKPYFYFIEFDALKLAVKNSQIGLSTEELLGLRNCASFVISLQKAIASGNWFEEHASSKSRSVSLSMRLSVSSRRSCRSVLFAGNRGRGDSFHLDFEQLAESEGFVPSVAYLLQQDRSEKFFPRSILVEIERIEREFQNQQVEVRLVQAVLSGREYLRQTENFEDIDTSELQEVVDIASSLRNRSLRNAKLFDAATKILHLRLAVKSGDWISIRYCIAEAMKSEIAPEAAYELKELVSLSEERNPRMHALITEALENNRISGTFMKLDASNVDVMQLLTALRASVNVAKISHEDKQLIYTAERIRNVRISILMCDYPKLVQESSSVNLSLINTSGLEEMLLVKKAIDFFENVNAVNRQLAEGRCKGTAGQIDIKNLSIYQLSNALNAFNLSTCDETVKRFLQCAARMKDLRSAAKGDRWCVQELVSLILETRSGKRQQLPKESPVSASMSIETLAIDTSFEEKIDLSFSNEPEASATTEQQLTDSKDSSSYEFLGFKKQEVIEFDFQREMFGNVVLSKQKSFKLISKSKGIQPVQLTSAAILPEELRQNVSGASAGIGYLDDKGKSLCLANFLGDSSLAEESVPRCLFAFQHVMHVVEEEILLLRDEIYCRICTVLLREAIKYSNGPATPCSSNVSVSSPAISTESLNYGTPRQEVDIDFAIDITKLLGCKSRECRRLLRTAEFVQRLRQSIKRGHAEETMAILGEVGELKKDDLFDLAAVTEVDDVFNKICIVKLKEDVYRILRVGTEAWSNSEIEVEFQCDTGKLRKALRRIQSFKMGIDEETSNIVTLCTMLLDMKYASQCGVLDRMASCCTKSAALLQSDESLRQGMRNFSGVASIAEKCRQFLGQLEAKADALRKIFEAVESPSGRIPDRSPSDEKIVVQDGKPVVLRLIEMLKAAIGKKTMTEAMSIQRNGKFEAFLTGIMNDGRDRLMELDSLSDLEATMFLVTVAILLAAVQPSEAPELAAEDSPSPGKALLETLRPKKSPNRPEAPSVSIVPVKMIAFAVEVLESLLPSKAPKKLSYFKRPVEAPKRKDLAQVSVKYSQLISLVVSSEFKGGFLRDRINLVKSSSASEQTFLLYICNLIEYRMRGSARTEPSE